MKKLFSILLALSLFAGASVSSFASGSSVSVEQEVTTTPSRPSSGGGSGGGGSSSSGGGGGNIVVPNIPSGGGGGGGGRLGATGSVEAVVKGSKDFYVSQAGHKIYWGGGVSINYRLADEDYSLLVAIYDGNKLIYSDMTKLDESVTEFVFSEQTARLSYVPENVTAKAFLWGSVSGCKPLCDAVEIKNVPRNTYYAKGRVIGIPQMGYMNWDEVEIQLEYSDDYFGGKIDSSRNGEIFYEIVKVDDTDIFNLAFETMDFVIAEDDDGNRRLLSYTVCDYADIMELYSGEQLYDINDYEITFSTIGGTKTYELSYECNYYVNGVEIWRDSAWDYMYSPAANIKLLDIPMHGEKSGDGIIDYVFVDYYSWAVVDSVAVDEDQTDIYLNNFEPNLSSVLSIDYSDEDIYYNIYDSFGEKLTVDAIEPGDAVLVKYDVINSVNDSMFMEIIICKSTITGVVESYDREYVRINGMEYRHTDFVDFSIGITNTYVLDIFGRIIAVAAPEPISMFSIGIAEEKYFRVDEVNSLPKLLSNEEGFRIEGKLDLETLGEDTYDVIFNVMNGSEVVYEKTLEADSRMDWISISEPVPGEAKDTMYMTVELVHNGKQLYPVAESDITDGYAHALGRVEKMDKPGVVGVSVEYCDDFFGEKIDVRYDGYGAGGYMLYDENAISPILYAYAELTIDMDKYGNYILKDYKLHSKNDIVYLKASDFEYFDDYDYQRITIAFEVDGKVKEFKLSEDAEMLVNGLWIDLRYGIDTCLTENEIGNVILLDAPRYGESAKDGKYDYVMVEYSQWAVVDSIEGTRVYFSDFGSGLSTYIDVEGKDCKYFKNGLPAGFNDIKPGNVLNIKYDVDWGARDSEFYEIEISDAVISGQVAKKTEVDDKLVYTVNGNEYYPCSRWMNELEVGSYYDIYLDSYGRIAMFEENNTDKNYGVIDRVYYDYNLDEQMVRIIKADGTREAYTARDYDVVETASQTAYGDWDMLDGTLVDMEDRIVSYKLNSGNELTEIRKLGSYFTFGIYDADEKSIGGAQLGENTDLLNLINVYNTTSYSETDIKDVTYQDLNDGEEYSVICADINNSGVYGFAIIVEGIVNESGDEGGDEGTDDGEGEEAVEAGTGYGVIDRVYMDNNLGMYKARIINADGTRKTYVIDRADVVAAALEIAYGWDASYSTLASMDERVVSYTRNSDGVITDITVLDVFFMCDAYNEAEATIGDVNGKGYVKIDSETQIIDLSVVYRSDTYTDSDIKKATIGDLIDGESYMVMAAGLDESGVYDFLIVVDGFSAIGIRTGFAVVDSVHSEWNYEEECVMEVISLYDGSNDKKEYFVDPDIPNADYARDLKRGDVIVYGTDDNVITELNILFTEFDAYSDCMSVQEAYNFTNSLSKIPDPKGNVEFYLESGISKWDNSGVGTSNGWARVGFGAIVDKNAYTVTIAEIARAEDYIPLDGYYDINCGDFYSGGSHQKEFEIANDVNVYLYDYAEKNSATSGRLSYTVSANILETPVAATLVSSDEYGNNVYNWSELENEWVYPNLAYFKVVKGEITDILVILPKE